MTGSDAVIGAAVEAMRDAAEDSEFDLGRSWVEGWAEHLAEAALTSAAPVVLAALKDIQDRCITGPEKRAVADCAAAVEKLLGVSAQETEGAEVDHEAQLGVVTDRQSAGDSADTCAYCGHSDGHHTSSCPVIS